MNGSDSVPDGQDVEMRMERAVRKPKNAAMTLAMILLCLVLVSSYLTAGMLARYTTTDMGGDVARVAKFVFNVKNEQSTKIVDVSSITSPDSSAVTYHFSVNGKSEVSVKYMLKMSLNGSMPLIATLSKEDGSDAQDLQLVPTTDYDFENAVSVVNNAAANVFAPNIQSGVGYKITVKWASGDD